MSNQHLDTDLDERCCEERPLLSQPLSGPAAAGMAARFKALSDPVRLRLLSAVASYAGGQACVCDITVGLGALGVGQPTISHHLKVLRESGLVTSSRRGSWVYYSVVPEALDELSTLLAGLAGTAR
ncbi:Arsenic resistance transcriptional regulator ArsR1 [Mycobacterium attenuatum]|uniref:ArsR/SmtB family transcription factor n=1 Tax=Mycobacterium attenuatum TaxID=2341086 RepID=UPI000F04406A|nr:metalloregulator ArsR/SmtB family transcription factor [Mycobacterium attenuatum]VBA52153.1 Arsenic resistance transcriptional regulator ArsR1 [Mycobacterium attenuatum]